MGIERTKVQKRKEREDERGLRKELDKELDYPVEAEFCFTPVQGEEQESDDIIPEAYEPVEVTDHGEVNLLQIFEDELLLSLPIVPLHAESECTVKQDDMSFGKIEPEQERQNPFAVLKELKRDQE